MSEPIQSAVSFSQWLRKAVPCAVSWADGIGGNAQQHTVREHRRPQPPASKRQPHEGAGDEQASAPPGQIDKARAVASPRDRPQRLLSSVTPLEAALVGAGCGIVTSACIAGAFLIEDGLDLGEMAFGLARVAVQLARDPLRGGRRHEPQRLAALQREDVGLRGALEVVQAVEGIATVSPIARTP